MLTYSDPTSLHHLRLKDALLALQNKTLLARQQEINELRSQCYVITRHPDGRVTRKPMRIR